MVAFFYVSFFGDGRERKSSALFLFAWEALFFSLKKKQKKIFLLCSYLECQR